EFGVISRSRDDFKVEGLKLNCAGKSGLFVESRRARMQSRLARIAVLFFYCMLLWLLPADSRPVYAYEPFTK
ncbi:hypothetical protein A2U01_0069469, partial [Trifolium medium]|nr:hypothetical protein [Trifolium medium]